MNYPEDFKNRCKEAFPEWKELHGLLDKGSRFAGRYLCDAAPQCDAKELSRLIISDHDAAMSVAKQNILASDLYKEWGELDEEQRRRE